MLKVIRGTGFFSCTSERLIGILDFFNSQHVLPSYVDSSNQYCLYKRVNDNRDITDIYFTNTDDPIEFKKNLTILRNASGNTSEDQFANYKYLNYVDLKPFIQKYFSPSPLIQSIVSNMEQKYAIDYNNTCLLFYRGNDKVIETLPPTYDEFVEKARHIQENNPGIRFFIQSDETEFIERMTREFPSSFYCKHEIRHMKRGEFSLDFAYRELNNIYSIYYMAITLMMARCKYIVCTSGNCSLWILLYRGHANNLYQYLSQKEYIYGRKNELYDPSQTNFWLE
jgi:hypothetical protein